MVCIQSSLKLAFFSIFSYTLVAAEEHRRDKLSVAPTVSTSKVPRADLAAAGSGSSVIQGDSQCPSQLMCVTGMVNESTVTYKLQSTGAQSSGWMAIGFGTTMGSAPMVILWSNMDGTISLSQRQAVNHMMPLSIGSPTNVATTAASLSTLSSSQLVLAFTMAGSAQQVPLIWAYGDTKPAVNANSTIKQHLAFGKITLDLTKTLSLSNVTSTPTSSSPSGSGDGPLLPYEKTIVAHAIVATFGFLFLLPSGVLLARYTRTISKKWYTGHWIIQAALGGPVIAVGCALGFLADHQLESSSSSPHKTMGVILLAIYIAQCLLGAFIHYVKIPFRFGRSPQNYAHAILGLSTIALALNQVHTGYNNEWPEATGRAPLGNIVYILWITWVLVLAFLYFGGLAYLPRQWRQERENVKPKLEYEVTYADSQEFNSKYRERFA